MEERKSVKFKKDEFGIREYIKKELGKGKVSKVKINYTPVGEKITVSTHKPGLVIGRKGERINELTRVLKKQFGLENPHVEIDEILKPELDAQLMADEIALGLERLGPIKFKVLAYRTLQRIMAAGALGVEIRLHGKLPSSRAKQWRFAQGYLKKTGHAAKVVDTAQARAETKPGTVGIRVSILSPEAKLLDRVKIDEDVLSRIRMNQAGFDGEEKEKKNEKKKPKKSKKKKPAKAKEIKEETEEEK